MRRTALGAVLVLGAPGPGTAQRVVFRFEAAEAGTLFGFQVRGIGDLDGDGRSELIVTDPEHARAGSVTGRAVVYRGLDGSILYDLLGPDGSCFGFSAAPAGDVNDDGTPDFMVGAPEFGSDPATANGLVRAWSGADGSLLIDESGPAFARWGTALSDLDDVDLDGHDDVLLGLPYGLAPGRARVYSGDGFSLLAEFTVPGLNNGSIGLSVSPAPDVTGDGILEMAVASPDSNDVWMVDPTDVSVEEQWTSVDPNQGGVPGDGFGKGLAPAGDVDGDGTGDVLVGSPVEGPDGHVYAFSGADGSTLWRLAPLGFWNDTGEAVASAGDLDGDGFGDFWSSSPPSTAVVWSGASGVPHARVRASNASNLQTGAALDAADVDGDGLFDPILALAGQNALAKDVVYVLAGASLPTTYCTAKTTAAGCAPSLVPVAVLDGTTRTRLELESWGTPDGAAGLFAFGTSGATAVPFQGGTLCVQPPLARSPLALSSNGFGCKNRLTLDFTAVVESGDYPFLLPGVEVHAQGWFRDPTQPDGTGVGLTNAARFRVEP